MHTTRGRELELSTEKLKIQKTSQSNLTLFQMPVVIWERWIAYGMWAILISALITFSIQKQRLLLKIWAHSRKMAICSSQQLMMQMQPFRNDCIGAPPLVVFLQAFIFNCGYGCASLEELENALLRL